MIELRWFDRKSRNLHPMTNVYPEHPREKVLQYRQSFQPGDSGEQEWQDIPTVKEAA